MSTLRSDFVGAAAEADVQAPLWAAVDRLLDRAEPAGILGHRLGPLAANRLRRQGAPVPEPLLAEERAAGLATLMAVPLLQRIRDTCDGRLLLFKGPEVARLYPSHARRFVDLDVLAENPPAAHRALVSSGFVELADEDDYLEHHHLAPLKWPTIWLKVEVHESFSWPSFSPGVSPAEIFSAAVPSATGVDGLEAPNPVLHALVLASHAWLEEPLYTVRDLLDIAVVAEGVDEHEIVRAASSIGLLRLWDTTRGAIDALFYGGDQTFPLSTWARHLGTLRDRTVFEHHLQRWLHSFSELPVQAALGETLHVMRDEILPPDGDGWRPKLSRIASAITNPGARVTRAGHGFKRHEPPRE